MKFLRRQAPVAPSLAMMLGRLFLQPFLAYNTKTAMTYTLNTESSYDWTGEAADLQG